MVTKELKFSYEGKDLSLRVTRRKNMKSLRYRLLPDRDGLSCSLPFWVSYEAALREAPEAYRKLLRKTPVRESPIKGDSLYLFGELALIPGFSLLSPLGQEKLLKGKLLDYVASRTAELEELLKTKLRYKVKVRTMKTRYGVNNRKAQTITYSTTLVHYDKRIIDSVIVHELVHDFFRGHQGDFYARLYEIMPDYEVWDNKLKRGVFK